MSWWSKRKYKIAKWRVGIRHKMSKEYVPSDKESKVIHIVRTLIQDETSVMMVAPISKKRYIRNERRKMFVIMEDVYMTLASSKSMYYYNLKVNERVSKMLEKVYDNVLENRRNIMEKEMVAGVTNNLDFIANHMDDEITT